MEDLIDKSQLNTIRQQNSFQTKTEVSETPNPVISSKV